MVKHFSSDKTILLILLSCNIIFLSFLSSCKKQKNNVPEEDSQTVIEVENKTESEESFYSPAEDKADWVESLLAHIEEERIAEELAQMEEDNADYQFLDEDSEEDDDSEDLEEDEEISEEQEENPIEKFFENPEEGLAISGKDNTFRFFEFQNEILAPQTGKDGLVVVHSAKEKVSRIFYNPQYQIIKKEEWKIKSAADAKKSRTELFEYYPESGKVSKKEIITNDTIESINYNEDTLPVTSKKYAVEEDKQYILLEKKWTYDKEKRVLSNEQKEYSYENSSYKNKPVTFSKKYDYKYNEGEIPPDLSYYENNILKMKNKYTAEKGNYYSWIYFDDVFSVKTYYENDVKIRDEFFNGGVMVRTKVYQQSVTEENQETVIQQGENK